MSHENSSVEHLRPGAVWRNLHTDAETTVEDFGSRPEHGIGRGGTVRVPASALVFHTANTPPGFKRGAGQDLASFLEHWEPA